MHLTFYMVRLATDCALLNTAVMQFGIHVHECMYAYPTLIVNSCMANREAILSRLVRIDGGSEDGADGLWAIWVPEEAGS